MEHIQETLGGVHMALPTHTPRLIHTEINLLIPTQSRIRKTKNSLRVSELLFHQVVLLSQLSPRLLDLGFHSPFRETKLGAQQTRRSKSSRRRIVSLRNLIVRAVRIGPHEVNAIPLGELWPELAVAEGGVVGRVEGLVARVLAQHRPLLQVAVELRRALHLHRLPRLQVAGELERRAQVLAHGCVDGDRERDVHGCVGYCPEDERGPRYVPADVVLRAVGPQIVFLRIVEVGFQEHTWIVLFLRDSRWTQVQAIVFGAGLEHDAFWGYRGQRESLKKVGKKRSCERFRYRYGNTSSINATYCSLCTSPRRWTTTPHPALAQPGCMKRRRRNPPGHLLS